MSNRKGTNIYVCSHNVVGSYTKLCMIRCMYTNTCEYLYAEVVSVSTHKGTNKCESAQHRLIYQRIRDMILDICILVSICIYICMQRGSNCEHSQGYNHMSACTTWVHVQKYLWWNNVYLWAHVCMQRGSKCEHSQGHRHMWVRTTWVHIKNSICDMIYVYFWVYACIQRGSNCEHSKGHRHMWVRTTRSHTQKYL